MSAPARRWLELSARCPTAGDRAPLLAEGLLALGGRAAEERAGWYVTHLADPGDVDGLVERARELLAAESGLTDIEVRAAWREDEEWAEWWKRGLAVRRVSERIVVRPSWIEPEGVGDGDVVLVIDPGVAFGTAEHGTTRGCLRLLDAAVQAGDRVIDVGAGSGILSVAAALLGAGEVVAIEGDPLACEALAENLAANGVAGRVVVECRWADTERLRALAPAAGVVANLEHGIVLPILPALVAAVAAAGWLILSGILASEWDELTASAAEAGADLERVDADGEWRSGLFRRRA